jgi:signal transduction histidine kinase
MSAEISTSRVYKITFYPTDDLYETYVTSFPFIAGCTCIGIIGIVSAIFFVYDYFVRKDSHEQHVLLDAKRKYVRFISHEIRTPLNAVSMASTILREEIGKVWQLFKRSLSQRATMEIGESKNDISTDKTESDHSIESSEMLSEASTLCQEIVENTQSAIEVLNDLLDYDKIEVN